MTIHIYYFSGTGNSLAVARRLGNQFDDAKVESIPKIMCRKEKIEGDVIGIVCPIYMHNLPHIVVEFVKKIECAQYIFLVYAGAGDLGKGDDRADALFESCGLTLSALFNVPMPSNYTNYGCPSPETQKRLLEAADTLIPTIAEIVADRKSHRDKRGSTVFQTYVHPGILYQLGYRMISKMGSNFSIDGQCNGCGICMNVCPVKNVEIVSGRPKWRQHCEQCYGCLQWCPKTAIQAGKKTVGVPRYHHRDVTLKEIIQSAIR